MIGIEDPGDLEFNDASLRLDDQTIHWGKTEELFTYPLKGGNWDAEVSEVVFRLRPDLK